MSPAPLRKNYRWLPVGSIIRKGDHQHFTVTASRLTVCDGARVIIPKTYSRKRRYAARKP